MYESCKSICGRGATIGNRGAVAVCDESCRLVLVVVAPDCEQFVAQHKRAAATSGVCSWASAFLQQSISPPMLHSCSFECRGIPAATPAPTARMSRIFVILFNIAITNVVKYSKACQDKYLRQFRSWRIIRVGSQLCSGMCFHGRTYATFCRQFVFDLPFGEEEARKGGDKEADDLLGTVLGHIEIAPIVTLSSGRPV